MIDRVRLEKGDKLCELPIHELQQNFHPYHPMTLGKIERLINVKGVCVFHPWRLLYRFWNATLLIFSVFPFCWISFSKMEASVPPD